ncbi:hypothetical protein FB382_002504 [Nocardioides ginsengisegetis]|uniref:Uncharacterized protein n=1 Tax=Nocardioides ginsengisegetis TaxID=661491 RepID=A0A7W3J0T7_9ACTN|nr:hypothetical protein [Nocardioides ginsengisegetis]MBA8804213.1 hypothetical protein [Nocardioides ginsengisegetis]
MSTTPQSARSEVLTPAPAMKVLFSLVAVFFCGGLLQNLPRILHGDLEWTLVWKIGFPILVIAALASVVGAVAAFTNKVWIDYDRNEIHQYVVLRDVAISLDEPTTVELGYTRQAVGSTVSGTWRVVVRQPGRTAMGVSTPWVRDIADVLRILQPALARNPRLAADEHTRAAIEDPGNLTPPPR